VSQDRRTNEQSDPEVPGQRPPAVSADRVDSGDSGGGHRANGSGHQ
jgi:hypothetical protein